MGAQELIVVLIALAAGGYLLRGWIVSARQGRCGGGGCGCGGRKCPPDEE